MSSALVQRQAGLAAVALLATIGALALGRGGDDDVIPAAQPGAPQWQEARAGVFGSDIVGQTTACGVEVTPTTIGVAHPVLPCGVDLVVAYGDRARRVEVIARGAAEGGRELDLSSALARELGFRGGDVIRWRFAG